MFETLSDKFADAFKSIQGKSKISEENIEETLKSVRTALLEADVNYKVVKDFIQAVKEKSLGEKVIRGVNPGEQFVKIVHDELARMMGEECEELPSFQRPFFVVLVVGLNGAGKTTFSGKLANFLKSKKEKNILLVPADTFRPAAKAQLQTLAKSIGIECYDSDLSLHPKDIAKNAIKMAREEGNHHGVIIDLAGRLHVDTELMQQLREVKESLESWKPEVLLVADAMTGQEAVSVAQSFHETVGLTGVVLSKMDSDARGGAALSIRYSTGVPLRFLSMGEKMKDLELFHPDRLAKRILDMGDVLSLVEKAQDAIDEHTAMSFMNNLEKRNFTIHDFLQQMNAMNKMGSFGSILKMIPGMGGLLRSVGDLSPAEDEMKRMKIMIASMTNAEKLDHRLMNTSRIERIAKGSGRTVQEVKEFLKKFEQMRSMMIGMMDMMKGGGGGMGGLMNMMGGGGMGPGMGFPGGPQKGFRAPPALPGSSGKGKKKGKRRGPFGGGFF